MLTTTRMRLTATVSVLALGVLTGCGGGSTVEDPGAAGSAASLRAGYLSAIDQVGLPLALENGYFEDRGLNVEVADPFPTGVDALNALQAGEVDLVQVGTPLVPAAQKGDELVLVGTYTGSASQASIDDTMAVVATPDAGISADDLGSLRGKRIGVSVGSINHLYLLGLLEEAGLKTSQVTVVNTAPPDLGVALETGGIDAAIVWDPWPITITDQVDGAEEVMRGGGYIPFVGYQVTTREFLDEHPDEVADYLAARAEVDRWIRENPDEAGEAATRWLPGTESAVAQQAMQHNVKQLDPRFSACNYLALDTVADLMAQGDAAEPDFDPAPYFDPAPILEVMAENPDLFEGLPEIPAQAQVEEGYSYDQAAADKACP